LPQNFELLSADSRGVTQINLYQFNPALGICLSALNVKIRSLQSQGGLRSGRLELSAFVRV